MYFMNRFKLGAHWLSVNFILEDRAELFEAMKTTVANGGKIFEIPYLLCKLPWKDVAEIARQAGIEEISLCHFWPINPDGWSFSGDPLSNSGEVELALKTLDEIIAAARTIRENGIMVRFIDGPTWGGLGKEYHDLNPDDLLIRAITFLDKAGRKCATEGLILATEFLRRGEDKVVSGTQRMLYILRCINNPAVRMHFDSFHSVECDENPATMIHLARNSIVYLHLHGDKRIAPGAHGDLRDWVSIIEAVKLINSGVTDIPIVSEPFGKKTCEANKALGEGLPEALALDLYLPQAFKTFRAAGLVEVC